MIEELPARSVMYRGCRLTAVDADLQVSAAAGSPFTQNAPEPFSVTVLVRFAVIAPTLL